MAQSAAPSLLPSQPILQKKRTMAAPKKYFRNEISNYKLIKYVSLDHVGKRFYPLERIHKNELQEQARQNKPLGQEIYNKFTGVFTNNSKKINEEGNVFLQVNVNINPHNGSKEITVSSSVKFYNFLDIPIELGFLANGQMKESFKINIEAKQMYPIPLEFLENKTEVRFVPSYQTNLGTRHLFSEYEYKYYQIENLICDNASLSDFEVDTENTVIDVLQ
jgi:vacuolar protein sorting-associated protein 13A/C